MEYRLDLETIISVLLQRQESGVLGAELKRVPGAKGPCQAYLLITAGTVRSCALKDKTGRTIAEGEIVLQTLAGLGPINWIWTSQPDGPLSFSSSAPVTPSPPALRDTPVTPPPPASRHMPPVTPPPHTSGPLALPPPRSDRNSLARPSPVSWRLVNIDKNLLSTWPWKYRRVFVLIDGERSISKISTILGVSSDSENNDIVNVLRDLRARGFIGFDE